MYDVLTISRFIVNYSNDNNYSISNLRLQKLLYFVQAVFLCEKGYPCFKEKILAWDFGPVVQEAYNEFKLFGSSNISKITTFVEYDEDNFWEPKVKTFNDSEITSDDKETIKKIVDKLSNYSTTRLVSITHHQKPWIDAYEPGMNNEIETSAIKEYFSNE